jgi:hypothetical protein
MDDTATKLVSAFGRGIVENVTPYVPAVKRMAVNELLAFGTLLQSKDYDAAKVMIHEAMTPDELADEKEKLADLTAAMADENAARRRVAGEILAAILRAAFTIVVSAGLF